nr:uncharacterized protein CI109_003876 [Kwoniella shandongensis]KAA5527617.1 hypothetical protein CI109_003876 [Kwoniella shandongensis]
MSSNNSKNQTSSSSTNSRNTRSGWNPYGVKEYKDDFLSEDISQNDKELQDMKNSSLTNKTLGSSMPTSSQVEKLGIVNGGLSSDTVLLNASNTNVTLNKPLPRPRDST